MFKKILFIVFVLMFLSRAFGQDKTPVEMLGKNKGTIKVLNENDGTYIEALAVAKILKMQVSWFGKSGQLNLKNTGGYFCVLRGGQDFAVVNGKEEKLSRSIIVREGVLYVPFDFLKGSIGKAAGYDVSFSDNKISVEKFYNLELLNIEKTDNGSKIIFSQKSIFKPVVARKGKRRTEIFFPNAVIKRQETLSAQDNFIDRVVISENKKGVDIIFLLKKTALYNDIYDGENSTLVFEASKNKISKPEFKAIAPLPKESGNKRDVAPAASALPESSVPSNILRTAVNKVIAPSVVNLDGKPGKNKRRIRVLIDAGHGDKDPGAVRRGSAKEKDLNLAVAKELYSLLGKDKDFNVKMTRGSDVFITLGNRAKMANDFKADIFISIHANAAKRASADGFEVYFRSDKASSAEAAETAALENEALQYEGKSAAAVSFADLLLKSLALNENMNESSKIASHIRNAVAKNSRSIGIKVYQNNCIKQANFYVLRGVNAPAVLIEMGYLSNANDKKRLNSKPSRAKIAESLRDGIISYAKAEGWK
ncbi:MAG: N-acetylmuramoyl-L-alanine amidase [Elusimicrobiota bacterium]|jgi:N-acetylmuramoyl-L-alanine amidase|nr:N-acetylmuramoyl-L-alanine amidase [Elusimicrobiota bacterium]